MAEVSGNPPKPAKEASTPRPDRTARGPMAGTLSGRRQTLRSGSPVERTTTSLRVERGLSGGPEPMGVPGARSVFAAHQLHRTGSRQSMGVVFAVAAGRGGVPLRQERPELAADFSSQDRAGGGAHLGLFPVTGFV